MYRSCGEHVPWPGTLDRGIDRDRFDKGGSMKKLAGVLIALVVAVSTSLLNTGPAMAGIWPTNHSVTVEKNNGAQISAPDTSGMYCMGNRPPETPQAYVCWR